MFNKIKKIVMGRKKIALEDDEERFFIEDFYDFLRVNKTAIIKISDKTEITGEWLRFGYDRRWLMNYGIETDKQLFDFHKWFLIGSEVTQKRGKQ